MTSHYEFVFVAPTEVEKKEEIIARIRAIFKQNGAEVLAEKDWGEKKLAYPIRKNKSGYYFIWNLGVESSQLREIRRLLNFERTLLRYMLLEVSPDNKAKKE